jgi:hypothetical protein
MIRVRFWFGDKVVEDGFGVGLCTTMHNGLGCAQLGNWAMYGFMLG